MNFLDYGTYGIDYDYIDITILDVNVTTLSLIVSKGVFSVIDANDNVCHGYYIIIF